MATLLELANKDEQWPTKTEIQILSNKICLKPVLNLEASKGTVVPAYMWTPVALLIKYHMT